MAKSRKATGLDAAIAEHAGTPPIYREGLVDLPPGIRGGIAALTEARIGVYQSGSNAGKEFLYLAGSILEPQEVIYAERVFREGRVQTLEPTIRRVAGLFTRQTLPLCETQRGDNTITEGENVAEALNHIKIIAGEGFLDDVTDKADLEAALEGLVSSDLPAYFRFDTTASVPNADYPTERAWENWRGSRGLEGYVPPETDSVTDASGDAPESLSDEPLEPVQETAMAKEEHDLEALGIAADAGDESAEEKLYELAENNELTDRDDFDGLSWTQVAELLSESDVEPPKEGDAYKYLPPKGKRPVICEVTSVGEGSCDLLNVKTNAEYEDVPWDDLIEP